MWSIDITFEDVLNVRKKSSLFLNSDIPMSPHHISYPILWSGFLNNEKIIVKQLSVSSSHITDFEFVEYPEQYAYLKGEIMTAINNYLRVLD